jgi:hypothetical protein
MGITPIPMVSRPEMIDVTGFTSDGSRESLPAWTEGFTTPRPRPRPYKPPVPPNDRWGEALNLSITALFLALVILPILWWAF